MSRRQGTEEFSTMATTQRVFKSLGRRNASPDVTQGLDEATQERLQELYLSACIGSSLEKSGETQDSSRPSSQEEELKVIHSPRFRSRRNAIGHLDILSMEAGYLQNVRNCLKDPDNNLMSTREMAF